MDLSEITAAIKKITEYKLQINDYLDLIAIWYRDVLLFKATSDVNHSFFVKRSVPSAAWPSAAAMRESRKSSKPWIRPRDAWMLT